MAILHQPIPYPWCWSSCVFCFSCFRHARMCFHTLSQSFLSVPCSRVVTILQPIWPLLWSCMILATCSKESQALSPSSWPRRILWAAGGRCLVVVGPCRVVLGALLRGRGASTRVLASFSDSSAFIASFATCSSLSPRVYFPRITPEKISNTRVYHLNTSTQS